jgi:hypothetical protein
MLANLLTPSGISILSWNRNESSHYAGYYASHYASYYARNMPGIFQALHLFLVKAWNIGKKDKIR